MNRIYRLCWNAATSQWVAASELARNSRPAARTASAAKGPRVASIAMCIALALGAAGTAHAGQTGGQIVSGNGAINQSGAITTINQNSQQLSLNWQRFDIAPNETVNFVQPGRDAIAVNRILGNSASEIYGHLNANGQVWLINPNGVLFGQGSQVNVGGLVASTLDTSDSSLSSNTRSFSGDGKGSIVNKGSIRAANGGYVALLGNTVSNQGTISAQLGTVAMGGGSAVTLTFEGSQLLHLQVDRSTLDNLVENRQLVQADGGRVLMTAGAADSLLASTVNNTGVVRAQTVENHNGQIVLLGGMQAGHVNVEGTLDASAPNGGNGGSIETSAAFAHIGAASINASAPKGKAGTWLVDPYDLTIDGAAATTISNTLNGGTNVTETTTATGASGDGIQDPNGVGDINVNAAITWTNPLASLTLNAYRAINVNAPINGAGGVSLTAGGNGGNGNITLASGATIAAGTGITLKAANAFVNNAGASALTTSTGRWLVYSANPSGNVAGGLTPGFIQYNASTGTAPNAAAAGLNGFLYALAPTVNVTGLVGTSEKTYDAGTGGAPLTDANISRTGFLNGEKFALVGAGTYASADAASGIKVTSSGNAANYTFTDASGTIPVFGYTLTGLGVAANIGVIDPRQLIVNIINNPTKTYNATDTATLIASNYQMLGLQGTDGISFAQPHSVAYDSADAGARTVNATFVSSNFVAANGTKFSNYILPTSATGAGTINKAKVQLSGIVGTDKTYDGTRNDALDTSNANIFGVISGDNVTLDGSLGVGLFADANVGNGKVVSLQGFTLTGAKSANYELVNPTDVRGSIGKKTLTISGVSAADKTYNANTAAILLYNNPTLVGIVAADAGNGIAFTNGTGSFATRNVGNGIAVTGSGFALTGTGTGNYALAQPSGMSANITPAPLSMTITGNPTRVYNGSTNANIESGDVTIVGWQGTEGGTITQSAGATYASKDAGSRTVTALIEASDFSLNNGTTLSNYSFQSSISGLGTIAQAPLTWQIVENPTKVFDNTTDATLSASNYQVYGFIAGEGASITQTHGTYETGHAGVQGVSVSVTPGDFSPISGTNLSNYILPSLITGFGTVLQADGSKVTVVISGRPTRIYDGTTVANLVPGDYTVSTAGGFPSGQGFTISKTTGTYASKNVGAQPVSVTLTQSDYVPFGGAQASDYTPFATVAYGTGAINPAPLTAIITGTPSKVYDGTTYITLNKNNYDITGFVAGEGADIVPSKSVAFDDKNVGTGKTITAEMALTSYLAHSNTDLSNYTLDLEATGAGTITAAPLYILGVTAQGKVYDTNTNATLNSGGAFLSGLVVSDAGQVSLVKGTTGTFDSANAGARTVTAAGFSITGAEQGNYTLMPLTGLAATISPFTLNILGAKADGKTYDGTTLIALDNSATSLDNVFASDAGHVTLNANGATGNTRSANAANGLAVTTQGYTLGGDRAGNYQVNQVSGLTADISRAPLFASIIGNPTKPYDGSKSVTLLASDYSLTGFATGENATIPQSSTASYNSANAGTHVGLQSTLSVSDFVAAAGTNLANYILPTGATGTLGTITPFVITLAGGRVYDATTKADATLFTSTGLINGVNGEQITLGGFGSLASKNVGNENLADVSTFVLGNASGLAQNYSVVGSALITKANLSVDGTTVLDHVYDTTRNATLTGATLVGRLGSDDVTLNNTTAGTFNNKNAGSGKAVANTMNVSGLDINNYNFTAPTLTGKITPLGIDVTALADNKIYDATTAATATLNSTGRLGTDVLGYSYGSATFDTKDVGTGKTVTVSSVTLTGTDKNNYTVNNAQLTAFANVTPRPVNLTGTRIYDTDTDVTAAMLTNPTQIAGIGGETLTVTGTAKTKFKDVGTYKAGTANDLDISQFVLTGNGAALASNYTFVGGSQTFSITPYTVAVGATGISKVYDATTGAVVTLVAPHLLGTDSATFNYTGATFSDKNAADNKVVTVTGITATGTDAGNYTFSPTTTTTANITKLAIDGTITAANKVYDGGVTATTQGTLAGVLGSDDIDYTATSGSFTDKNVQNGKTVNVAGTIGGADANNYIVTSNTTTSADITPLAITIGATANDKMYDGNNVAVVHGLTPTGFITGDDISFVPGADSFSDANAAIGKQVTVNNIAGSGADIGNYTWNTTATTLATITPYIITLHGTRQYDGSTTIAASAFASDFQVDGILGDTLTLSGAGSVGDKNVGTAKPLTAIGTLGLQGNGAALSSNYTLIGGMHDATITPKQIVVDATGSNKVYDGNTLAVAGLGSTGIVGGDQIVFSGTGTNYSDKNVANGKTITVDGITASGTDATNYAFNQTAVTTGNITPLGIAGNIIAGSKTYDGNTSAQTSGTLSGVLAGDHLGVDTSGNFADKNAGNGKTVNVAGVLTGADAGNYTLTTNATTLADVYKVVLNLDGTRVYDGGTVASAGMFGTAGVIAGVAGENLILSGQGVLGSKNVATDRPLAALGSLALNDDGAGLASNYTLIGGNHIATVTPLGINAGITADDKVYDGNTGAVTHGVLSGVLGGDQVSLSTNGAFVDKNAANGKTVNVDGSISGGDAGNYVLSFNPTTVASITKRPVVVDAKGTDKFFDGNTADRATLSSSGILPGDVIAFGAASALFGNSSIGLGKAVSVSGIYATGPDAGNYAFNTSADTTASINQNPAQGASGIAATQIDALLGPDLIATPYGAASNVTVGPFSGNHKKTRQPIEKNVQRADFVPGLSLQVVDGGVRLPADAMQ
jgi:filamentous hemagglutinin family protein